MTKREFDQATKFNLGGPAPKGSTLKKTAAWRRDFIADRALFAKVRGLPVFDAALPYRGIASHRYNTGASML